MPSHRLLIVAAATIAALSLAGCSGTATTENDAAASSDGYPIVIEHALGTTTLESKPERVATVNWANHEVPLALGIVPVGMAAANFGDDDGDGVLPWVTEKLDELGAEVPVLFDETDGIDFEAVADTKPDVILAAYSGLTQEDYDTLSEIAPVVAYPEAPWATSWRDVIRFNSEGLGMAEEGEKLVAEIEDEITTAAASYPANDTRSAFFDDLGLATPASIAEASTDRTQFSGTISAEQVDTFSDVDIIVTYGDAEMIATLQADPLLSQMPAVANDAIVALPGTSPLGTAANPTPLAISWVLDDYLALLAEAADKVK
jgi:iron complex transport system substrate-binding protein